MPEQVQLFDTRGPVVLFSGQPSFDSHVGTDERTHQTIEAMRGITHASKDDPLVVRVARLIQKQAIDEGKNNTARGYAFAVYEFCRRYVRFARDPQGSELLRHPAEMIAEIGRSGMADGDCDDRAMLGCALLLAGGMRAAFVVMGRRPEPSPFEHVLYAWLEGSRGTPVPFDPQQATPPGLMTPGAKRVWVMEV